jgi:hypothetical protein
MVHHVMLQGGGILLPFLRLMRQIRPRMAFRTNFLCTRWPVLKSLLIAGLILICYPPAALSEKPSSGGAKIVFVKGEVRTPQWIELTSHLTALDSIKLTGGFLWPSPRFISVQRGSVKLTVDVRKARENQREDVELQPGDTVSVP